MSSAVRIFPNVHLQELVVMDIVASRSVDSATVESFAPLAEMKGVNNDKMRVLLFLNVFSSLHEH